MTKQKYEQLTTMIRRLWESSRGLVVELRKIPETEEPELVLTIGKLLNPQFAARQFRLWKGEKCLTEGKLLNGELRAILTGRRICHAAFRTANSTIDSRDWKAKRLCIGDMESCDKNCPLKGKANAEPNALSCTGEAVSQSGDSE